MAPSAPHIGLFNDSFPPIMDGVTLAVQNYAHYLAKLGLEPSVVTPSNPVSEEAPYPVLRYYSLPIRGRYPYRYGYPKLDFSIWKALRTRPFSLVHSHSPFSSGRLALYAARKQGIPVVGTFHSKYRTDLKRGMRWSPWLVPIIMRRILHFYNSCTEVWIPQAAVEETVREYGFKGHVEVVENGNDLATVPASELPAHKRVARLSLGIKSDEIALLFVGQHIYEKGLDIILDTLRLLWRRGVPFTMNFIGNGYALPALRHALEREPFAARVTVHGVMTDRAELARYYAASDLFLFPSFYDNAPLVVREAAAMGTPALIPQGSTASEVIRDGANGFLCQCTPGAYAEAVQGLAADRARVSRAGLGARATLARSWEDVVGEVALRYRDIIKNFKS